WVARRSPRGAIERNNVGAGKWLTSQAHIDLESSPPGVAGELRSAPRNPYASERHRSLRPGVDVRHLVCDRLATTVNTVSLPCDLVRTACGTPAFRSFPALLRSPEPLSRRRR